MAFAAAKNRWATEADYRRHGIEHFYYPPLYFLAFAPLWADEPSFVEGYPVVGPGDLDPNYLNLAGRRVLTADYLSRVPPPLVRLYRQAKLFSLACGLAALLALAATVRVLFPGPRGWWVTLLATAPAVLLPQFLYYHTLVNNDALLNALGAAAALCFTSAVVALGAGRQRSFAVAAAATAVALGLAILTKMSGLVLLPFAPGLVWARHEADRALPGRVRLGRAVRLGAALAALVAVSGGWWIGYKALQGDWSSVAAQRIAHPWAIVGPAAHAGLTWWVEPSVQLLRTYYALFAGALFVSVPDAVFLAWLAVPATVVGCAAVVAATGLRRRGARGPARPRRDLRRIVWMVLAAVSLANVAGVLLNLTLFQAAYGRLLFPSLVGTHAIAAAVVARSLRGRPRALAAVAAVLVAYAGLLFGWTFRHRMAEAVLQPAEDVRVLTGAGTDRLIGPLWEFTVAQSLTVPPGSLAALRVGLWRGSLWPQVGGWLEGSLTLKSPTGATQDLKVRRIALGDTDLARPWAELELERTVGLESDTAALLTLRGAPPLWLPGRNEFGYVCADRGPALRWNAMPGPCALCVAAVYRP